jgi:protein O-mannosyl-transferase
VAFPSNVAFTGLNVMRRLFMHSNAPRIASLLTASIILVFCFLAYRNTFETPFIFDDVQSIVENPTIRVLFPPWRAIRPPRSGYPVDGRPLINLSLAINYALGKSSPWGYHAVNLSIHVLTAMVLYGVVRRTLMTCPRVVCCTEDALATGAETVATQDTTAAILAAASVALLWAVHPLQTESVTYISQRAESLVSFFYLLTLYCAIRGATSIYSSAWSATAVIACTLGMASKEIMVSAPPIVLLYDRTFLSGSFREALQRRRGMYCGLAASWLVLAVLVVHSGGRGGTAGFGIGVHPWEYALTQCGAIPHYLRLCFLPTGLCLDYGDSVVSSFWSVAPQATGLIAAIAIISIALWRWPAAGFLGAFFLAVLAPTSSIVPVKTQTIAEHRMYLPLSAVIAVVVAIAYLSGQWLVRGRMLPLQAARLIGVALVIAVAVVLATITHDRNADYESAESIWRDTVEKMPNNERAEVNYGVMLNKRGCHDEAIAHFKMAIAIKPNSAGAYNNLGVALKDIGRLDDAIASYRKVLDIDPNDASVCNNLGVALCNQGQIDEAISFFNQALTIHPQYDDARKNLNIVIALREHILQDLAERYKRLQMEPNNVNLLNEVAWLRATSIQDYARDGVEAVALARRAVKLSDERMPAMLDTLAAAYAEAGRFDEAVQTAQKALDLALEQKNETLANSIKGRIRLYKTRTPFRTPPKP